MNIKEIGEEVIALGNKAREGAMEGDFVIQENGSVRAFFENQDNERSIFRNNLLENGYGDAGFNCEYLWNVEKDGVLVSYVEGDVYLKAIQ